MNGRIISQFIYSYNLQSRTICMNQLFIHFNYIILKGILLKEPTSAITFTPIDAISTIYCRVVCTPPRISGNIFDAVLSSKPVRVWPILVVYTHFYINFLAQSYCNIKYDIYSYILHVMTYNRTGTIIKHHNQNLVQVYPVL